MINLKTSIQLFFQCCLFCLLPLACNQSLETNISSGHISIIDPDNGSEISEDVEIRVQVTGGDVVKMVELWVDKNVIYPRDISRPFSFNLSTSQFADSTTIELFARAYFSNNQRSDSDLIFLTVNNSMSRPQPANITRIELVGSTLEIFWNVNQDEDFDAYLVFESMNPDMSNARLIKTITAQTINNWQIFNILPEQVRYYQIVVRDVYGLESAGNIKQGNSFSKILFISDREGNDDIYLMLSDGSEQIKMTRRAEDEYDPEFSPDQSMIVFITNETSNQEIYSMSATGKGPINISNSPGNDYEPDFSPDGQTIVFTSDRFSNYDVFVMDKSGNNLRQLTNDQAADYSPVFSADGRIIIFNSERTGNPEIFSMNIDGTNQMNLSQNSANDYQPQVAPVRNMILFVSDVAGNDDLYLMDINGMNKKQLTSMPGNEQNPRFSADGNLIIFEYVEENISDIYLINADGTDLNKLQTAGPFPAYPQFLNSGFGIVFQTIQNDNEEIFRIDLNGANLRNISDNPASDRLINPFYRLSGR